MDREEAIAIAMGTGRTREQSERWYDISRDIKVLDLEGMLSREMATLGFNRVHPQQIKEVLNFPHTPEEPYPIVQYLDDFMRERPHRIVTDENDALFHVHNKTGTIVAIRKRGEGAEGYWEKSWGFDVAYVFDFRDLPDIKEGQAVTLIPHTDMFSGLKTDGHITSGVFYAVEGNGQPSYILFSDGRLFYHQFMNFSRIYGQNGLQGEEKNTFIAQAAKDLKTVVQLNLGFILEQKELYKRIKDFKGQLKYAKPI